MRKFVQGVVEIRSSKLGAFGARARSRGGELETPRVSVIGHQLSDYDYEYEYEHEQGAAA